jgi:hypothetical protein
MIHRATREWECLTNKTLDDFGITIYELLNSGGERWRSDPNFLSPAAIERMQAPLPAELLDAIDEALDRRSMGSCDQYILNPPLCSAQSANFSN